MSIHTLRIHSPRTLQTAAQTSCAYEDPRTETGRMPAGYAVLVLEI